MSSTTTDRLNGINSGLAAKAPVRVVTNANITLSGEQTVNSVAVVAGDRVLVKDQSTASENGVYDVSTSAWSRSLDFDGSRDIVNGTTVFCNSNSTLYYLSATGAITVGTTSLTFTSAFSSPSDATLVALAAYNTNGLLTQTAADTFAGRTITGGGGITVTNGSGVAGNPTLSIANTKTLWIPSAAIQPSVTGGCANFAKVAVAANQPDVWSLDFDSTTAEYAQFSIRFPKSWDEGTVTAQFHWSHAATATNFGVRWGLQGVAVSDDDTGAVAYGTAQEVTDTGGTTNDLYISSATSAITIAGTPAAGDQVFFRAYRDPVNAGDTLAIDARLMGIVLFYSINTLDDA